MTTQSETLKFGPQWIRKLSDCAFTSPSSSTRSPTDNSLGVVVGVPIDFMGEEMRNVQNEVDKRSTNHVEGTDTSWDSICSTSIGEEGSAGSSLQRSHKTPGGGPKSAHNTGGRFHNYSYSSVEKNKLEKIPLDAPSWQKSTDQAVSDQNWRRHPQPINPPPDSPKWNPTRSPISTTCDTSLSRISGFGHQTNSLWDQQKQMWSKSTPQQLHGLGPLESVSVSVLGQNVSCSVPEIEKSTSLIEQAPFFESVDSNGLFHSSGSRATAYSSLEEERGLHRPDGADDPDEHMWFYEDPQGRTQGSFSDAQMNDWLLAGIYFTPNLRMRRKCDITFSTLADYTRLFGRIPFVPGPRVSPIRVGITPPLLSSLSKSGPLEHPSTSEHADSLGSSGLQHTLSSLSSGTQNSGTATTAPGPVGRIPTISSQQPSYSADFQNSFASSALSNQNDTGRLATTLPGTTSMCVNSSLPVLQSRPQGNPPPHNLGCLGASTEPIGAGNVGNSVNGASAFMALASLLSMNPTLASLALSFSGQTSSGHNADLAAAALTPGFLSALAQYLNVQPHSSGHQPTSPMQQLAETAQLAAQLAALAGAHSPDQTPMQPEQALALAQLVISQASNPQWVVHSKKDGSTDASHDPETDAVDRRLDKTLNDDSTSRSHSSTHPSADDSRSDQQSHWPPLFSSGNTTRSSPRFGEGRFPTKGAHDASQHGETRDGQSRTPAGFPNRQQQSKSTQAIVSQSAKSKYTSSVVLESGQVPEPVFPTPNQSAWRGTGDITEDSHANEEQAERSRGLSTQPHSSRASQPVGQWAHKSAAAPNSTRSPTNHGNKQAEIKAAESGTSGPDHTSAHLSAETDRTAQEELERLTLWCQTRLSSISLKEKVDIPTVVELLATLDAPYEVERMVQTFMGESARTSSFVKDFLDRRRPFWQLHRARREDENFTRTTTHASNAGNGSTPKSNEKKKRSGGQEHSVQTTHRHNSGSNNLNGTSGWTKLSHGDHSQDNQWHHIKPKGSHNRKNKKDKTS